MKILACGGRDFTDAQFVWETLRRAHAHSPITLLINGGAEGADKLAEQWADANGIHYARVPALWKAHGRAAGPKRNETMLLLKPDAVVAFPGGRGTAHMIRIAREAGIPVWIPETTTGGGSGE